jgi:hypothetical protein
MSSCNWLWLQVVPINSTIECRTRYYYSRNPEHVTDTYEAFTYIPLSSILISSYLFCHCFILLVLHVMNPSVTQTRKLRIVGWLLKNGLKNREEGSLKLILRYCLCLEVLKKSTQKLSQDSQCANGDLIWSATEHENWRITDWGNVLNLVISRQY